METRWIPKCPECGRFLKYEIGDNPDEPLGYECKEHGGIGGWAIDWIEVMIEPKKGEKVE